MLVSDNVMNEKKRSERKTERLFGAVGTGRASVLEWKSGILVSVNTDRRRMGAVSTVVLVVEEEEALGLPFYS